MLLLAVFTVSFISYLSISQRWFSKKSSIYEQREENDENEEGEEGEQQSGAAKQLSGWFQAKGFPDAENLTAKYQNA